jgi:6-phosphogluconolactonase (cycloisomerase 2 family)
VVTPTGITVLPSKQALYVSAYDTTANKGYVFGFSVASDGALTALNGGVPVSAGVKPSAITTDSTGSYIYVTDATANDVLGYTIGSTTLIPLTSGTGGRNTFPAGNQPSAILADPEGGFIYVTNLLDATITAYSMNSGALTRVASYATGLQPVALGMEPSMHRYLYTVNFLAGSISDFEVSATDGSLINAQGSPFTSNALPTAVAAIPHGGAAAK